MRTFVLCENYEEVTRVTPRGTPCYNDPVEALEAAKAAGAKYILQWDRNHYARIDDGEKTTVDLKWGRAIAVANARLVVANRRMMLQHIDPDLPIRSFEDEDFSH